MPNYRRAYVPGGLYFFTLKTERNAPIFQKEWAAKLLGEIFREAKRLRPFETNAAVLLPDHLHAIWSLPSGDADYSTRWAWIKKEFTIRYLAAGGKERPVSDSRHRNRRRGVWQRRFWEHTIESEADYDAHFDYLHWNPVKHGYVKCPKYWKFSTFHRWVEAGVYPLNWGCGLHAPPTFANIATTGE
ncbi:transposase [Blastopirellula sp. J2-11]|uniref:REP-associated tyrosine transposase n=1 Tax=Blastopirellula sp. J2-11 TaxID=2943192 RepID=UPI0021CA2C49|nr:transposase [Blastopirellula sp. J2-11]UUO07376.1 transposase [Blastopirellula sp. J2-11]